MPLTKIMHITTGLAADGAERMLQKLVTSMDSRRFVNEIVSLTNDGALGSELRATNFKVHTLEMGKSVHGLFAMSALPKILRESQPDVVQTWMYHADLVGGLATYYRYGCPVMWGIHHASLSVKENKLSTVATAKTCAKLSSFLPSRIVCVSEASRLSHIQFGYRADITSVIPNGFDLEAFRPDVAARSDLRCELKVHPHTLLIGMAARFHPNKDHGNFLQAASLLSERMPDVHFVLFGRDIIPENPALAALCEDSRVASRVHVLGERRDVGRLFAGIDIVSSSSQTEAFPLAIGEAMACGIPCVVTDVGDSAYLVGDCGIAVPAKNPAALASAWQKLLSLDPGRRRSMGAAARRRVEDCFSLPAVVRRYEDLYSEARDQSGSKFHPARVQ